MTEESRIAPQYREMAQMSEERPAVPDAVSETQRQLLQMRSGERWSHEAARRVQNTGGNE